MRLLSRLKAGVVAAVLAAACLLAVPQPATADPTGCHDYYFIYLWEVFQNIGEAESFFEFEATCPVDYAGFMQSYYALIQANGGSLPSSPTILDMYVNFLVLRMQMLG